MIKQNEPYYGLLKELESILIADENIKNVMHVPISDIDNDKQTEFELANVVIENITEGYANSRVLTASISVYFMDIDKKDKLGYAATDHIHNTLLVSAMNFVAKLRANGELNLNEMIGMGGDVTYEPFQDKDRNLLVGWIVSMDINFQIDLVC